MAKKSYNIFLDNTIIGTTELEKGDAPMGCVLGQIKFNDTKFGFDFLKEYCLKNKIEFDSYEDEQIISTRDIPSLKVVDANNKEIKGLSCYIDGMNSDAFYINLEGIPYPFYEEEFSRP